MNKFEIKNRFSGEVLFSLGTKSFKLCIEAAVKQNAKLSNADLSNADLSNADLRYADLSNADLSNADLRYADLRYAELRYAELSNAELWYAELWYAELRYANLWYADLRYADLSNADLRYADLRYADLSNADLSNAKLPAPPIILLSHWGEVSDKLCLDLMRYDAANHPDPKSFDRWAAETGSYPYDNCKYQRSANFDEKASLWKPGKAKSALELVEMLLKEKTKQ